jgi:hypothetical protein
MRASLKQIKTFANMVKRWFFKLVPAFWCFLQVSQALCKSQNFWVSAPSDDLGCSGSCSDGSVCTKRTTSRVGWPNHGRTMYQAWPQIKFTRSELESYSDWSCCVVLCYVWESNTVKRVLSCFLCFRKKYWIPGRDLFLSGFKNKL